MVVNTQTKHYAFTNSFLVTIMTWDSHTNLIPWIINFYAYDSNCSSTRADLDSDPDSRVYQNSYSNTDSSSKWFRFQCFQKTWFSFQHNMIPIPIPIPTNQGLIPILTPESDPDSRIIYNSWCNQGQSRGRWFKIGIPKFQKILNPSIWSNKRLL